MALIQGFKTIATRTKIQIKIPSRDIFWLLGVIFFGGVSGPVLGGRSLGHWNDLHLDLITPHFVTSEMDRLEANGTAIRALTADIQKEVKCLFSYSVGQGVLKTSPLATLKKRKVPKKKKEALTHDKADKLLREARVRNHPYFFIWLLTLTLGLRRSELAGLKWLDIDFDNRLAHLRRQLQPKEGLVEKLKDNEERTVAIPASVIPVLKEYRLRTRSEFVIDVDYQQWRGGHQALRCSANFAGKSALRK